MSNSNLEQKGKLVTSLSNQLQTRYWNEHSHVIDAGITNWGREVADPTKDLVENVFRIYEQEGIPLAVVHYALALPGKKYGDSSVTELSDETLDLMKTNNTHGNLVDVSAGKDGKRFVGISPKLFLEKTWGYTALEVQDVVVEGQTNIAFMAFVRELGREAKVFGW